MPNEAFLVTGGTGLIGAEVTRQLLDRGNEVIVLDRAVPRGQAAELINRATAVVGDVTQADFVAQTISDHRVTRIVHLAGLLTMAGHHDPAATITTNCLGTETIFAVARDHGVRRVVWTSTAGVYGTRPYYQKLLGRYRLDESDPIAPYDLYGSTKALCEMLSGQYRRAGLDVVGLRPVMTFGPGRLFGAVGVLNKAIQDAAVTGRGILTEPWSQGTSINPMYVKDAASIIIAAAEAHQPLQHPVYNLGTGEYLTIDELANQAVDAMPGTSIDFEQASTSSEAAGTPVFDYPDLDSSTLRAELGWSPRYTYRTAVAECMAEFRKNAAVGGCVK